MSNFISFNKFAIVGCMYKFRIILWNHIITVYVATLQNTEDDTEEVLRGLDGLNGLGRMPDAISMDDISAIPMPEFGSYPSPEFIDQNRTALDTPINSGRQPGYQWMKLNTTVLLNFNQYRDMVLSCIAKKSDLWAITLGLNLLLRSP